MGHVVAVEDDPHVRIPQLGHNVQGDRNLGEKRPVLGAAYVHRFHCQLNIASHRSLAKLRESFLDDPPSMIPRMTAAASRQHDQTAGVQVGGHIDRIERIEHRFAERPPIAAGKPARPMQRRDAHLLLREELDGLLVPKLVQLVTPHPERIKSELPVPKHIFLERPAVCRNLAYRQP